MAGNLNDDAGCAGGAVNTSSPLHPSSSSSPILPVYSRRLLLHLALASSRRRFYVFLGHSSIVQHMLHTISAPFPQHRIPR